MEAKYKAKVEAEQIAKLNPTTIIINSKQIPAEPKLTFKEFLAKIAIDNKYFEISKKQDDSDV
jgi:hypothetical protein